jgi:hypothetical protein
MKELCIIYTGKEVTIVKDSGKFYETQKIDGNDYFEILSKEDVDDLFEKIKNYGSLLNFENVEISLMYHSVNDLKLLKLLTQNSQPCKIFSVYPLNYIIPEILLKMNQDFIRKQLTVSYNDYNWTLSVKNNSLIIENTTGKKSQIVLKAEDFALKQHNDVSFFTVKEPPKNIKEVEKSTSINSDVLKYMFLKSTRSNSDDN